MLGFVVGFRKIMFVLQIGSLQQMSSCNVDVTNSTSNGWVFFQYTLNKASASRYARIYDMYVYIHTNVLMTFRSTCMCRHVDSRALTGIYWLCTIHVIFSPHVACATPCRSRCACQVRSCAGGSRSTEVKVTISGRWTTSKRQCMVLLCFVDFYLRYS